MGMQTAWLAGIVLGVSLRVSPPVAAAEAFVEIATSGIYAAPEQRQRHRGVEVDWVRRVRVHPAALQAREISIDLYDTTLYLVRDAPAVQAAPGGQWRYGVDDVGNLQRQLQAASAAAWAGTVQGSSGTADAAAARGTEVRIWASPRGFSAEFRLGRLHYQLSGDVLVKRDMRRFRVNENNDVRDVRPDRPTPLPDPRADVEPLVDIEHVVRVVYGLGARAAEDGVDPLLDQVRRAVADADSGFADSDVKLSLKTAAYVLPGYTETSLDQTLDDIVAGGNGPLWLLHIARERERADVMVMVVDSGADALLCGSAQQILATRETAFLAVERRCLSEHTLAHEIGHLLGADHNTENATIDPPRFAYGHGYRAAADVVPRWRTVMAQECPDVACGRVNLWSSPLIHHNGQPTGTVDVHDNARVLRETKAIIAGFYPDPPP